MAEIRWSLTAAVDLRAIEEYVARDSPAYAVRLTDRIIESVEHLPEFPLMGRVVPEFAREDLREIIYRSYRIVYLRSSGPITILRVVHSARDLARLLEREPWEIDD